MNFPINHTAFFHFYEQGVSRGGGAEGYAMGGQSEGGGGVIPGLIRPLSPPQSGVERWTSFLGDEGAAEAAASAVAEVAAEVAAAADLAAVAEAAAAEGGAGSGAKGGGEEGAEGGPEGGAEEVAEGGVAVSSPGPDVASASGDSILSPAAGGGALSSPATPRAPPQGAANSAVPTRLPAQEASKAAEAVADEPPLSSPAAMTLASQGGAAAAGGGAGAREGGGATDPLVGFPQKYEAARHFVSEGPIEAEGGLSPSDWLLLDALQQQAEHGPCRVSGPSYFDQRARVRWRAWKDLGERSKVEAMYLYTQAVADLSPRWWAWPPLGLVVAAAAPSVDAQGVAEDKPPFGGGAGGSVGYGAATAAAAGADSGANGDSSAGREAHVDDGLADDAVSDASTRAVAHEVEDLAWKIAIIMRQHAEDCKRMLPSDAALFARQGLQRLTGVDTFSRPQGHTGTV